MDEIFALHSRAGNCFGAFKQNGKGIGRVLRFVSDANHGLAPLGNWWRKLLIGNQLDIQLGGSW